MIAGKIVAKPLPPIHSRVEGSVRSFDWNQEEQRNMACSLLRLHAADDPLGPQEPILIKGAISQWPACQKWDLDYLQSRIADARVHVRCASSMKFFYVDQRLIPAWKKLKFYHRQTHLPSVLAPMKFQCFLDRIQADSSFQNIYFPEDQEEYYYLQTAIPWVLQQDLDVFSQPLSCLGSPGVTGFNGTPPIQPHGMQVAQLPRLYISPQGAVSPLHYDTSSSFLMQVSGRKRLLFYRPDQLKDLYCHKSLHILRRRSRVDPAKPDLKKYPRFQGLTTIEAVLEPGDVLWFPGKWSHHTESLDLSISMTYRFLTKVQRKEQKRKARLGILGLL